MSEGFKRSASGSVVERVAVVMGLVGLASLFVGSTVEQWASNGDLPMIAFLSPGEYVASRGQASDFKAIDYSATGSIGGRVVLDPCTGERKP